ncbi:MAG: hypothetical protein AMK75_03985 [Planctomycetes bacterium SM23_65]|nr:MAG: hypothetical protein AMK75_03985 [Planctomycetes bacterium SM23_65]
MCAKENGKRFILYRPTREIEDFRAFAADAVKLKPYGKVLLDVGTLADKSFHEIPEGGSSWHEYAVCNPALHKVFPHPKIAPHVPADFVKKNRELLLAKAAVVRELGLRAAFVCHEPFFMPESLFQERPHLRGPRIDHPRRSRREEFALCTDLDESREMIAWMTEQLKVNVPELEALLFNTNDAGSGLCWAGWQYSGPNGPRHCRAKSSGQRVKELVETFQRGARAGGGEIAVYILHANFELDERRDVLNHLPPNTVLTGHDPSDLATGSGLGASYPARDVVDPLSIITAMERVNDPAVRTVRVHLAAYDNRDRDTIETVAKVLEIMTDCMDAPPKGLRGRLAKLHDVAERWAGKENAEAVFEALYQLHQAFVLKQAVVRRFVPIQGAVSMRHLTRPLVIKPELLTPEEESYFLPHIFNIRETEARTDYIDLHGGRMQLGAQDARGIPAFERALEMLRGVAGTLEDAKDGPEGRWLFKAATGVRVYVHLIRSMVNFYFGQKIRDRHAAELAREQPVVPEKVGSWEGEGEILAWNERMRDEFDNASELIALLEERGLDQLCHARDTRHQDTFVLGPDVLGDLKKKVRIMRDHWLDVERYLAPPHK